MKNSTTHSALSHAEKRRPSHALSLLPAIAITFGVTAVAAQEAREVNPRHMALGVQLDLFPTVVSAVDGNLGYAPQLWLGIDHVRLRLISAHLKPPDAMAAAPDGFTAPTIQVFAVVFDYTFGDHFDQWWVGSGFEQWTNTIEHDSSVDQAAWNSTIFTLGGGYIWRIVGDFYVDFWAGLHLTLNPQTVSLAGDSYEPMPVTASGGMKVGYFLDI